MADIKPGIEDSASPGIALTAARKAQGLSVEQVAGRLRLAPFQINAIEAGDFAALPGVVFARGFVRNYARLLNLDAEPLLSAMTQQLSPGAAARDERLLRDVKGVAMDPVRFRRLPVAAVVIAGLVGVLAFYEFVLNDSQTASPPVAIRPAPTRATASENMIPAMPVPTALLQSPDAAQNPADDAAATRRGLHFLFSRESWVEVRDGLDNILFSKINLPGTEHHVQGEPPFNIVVGGAHGVQLAYNGTPVDLAAHATEGVARLRLK